MTPETRYPIHDAAGEVSVVYVRVDLGEQATLGPAPDSDPAEVRAWRVRTVGEIATRWSVDAAIEWRAEIARSPWPEALL